MLSIVWCNSQAIFWSLGLAKKGSYLGGSSVNRTHPIGYGNAGVTVGRADVWRETYDPDNAKTYVVPAEIAQAQQEEKRKAKNAKNRQIQLAKRKANKARKQRSAEQKTRRERERERLRNSIRDRKY